MNPLVLVWAVCFWTTGSSLTPSLESEMALYTSLTLYTPLNDTATLTCECSNGLCQTIFWFRTFRNDGFQFLISINSAERVRLEDFKGNERFKASLRKDSGVKVSSVLRISDVTPEDAGLYSCLLWNPRDPELWRPGILLRPGESRPTPPAITRSKPPPVNPMDRCSKSKNKTMKGCDSNVLRVLVGVMLALVVALVSTLYYFSRLPRKCRHHFVKCVNPPTPGHPLETVCWEACGRALALCSNCRAR